MKRRVLATFLVTAMTMPMLFGCGSNSETTAVKETDKMESTEAGSAEAGSTETSSKDASGDAISNLIAATEGTVDLTLWCAETTEYQTV